MSQTVKSEVLKKKLLNLIFIYISCDNVYLAPGITKWLLFDKSHNTMQNILVTSSQIKTRRFYKQTTVISSLSQSHSKFIGQ